MANYETLKAAIQSVVKTNGNNEITGALLQQSLLAMINSLGANYQFAGVAELSTDPGTPDQNVFWIAATNGTYVNFSRLNVTGNEVAILYYNGLWNKLNTGIPNKQFISLVRNASLFGYNLNLGGTPIGTIADQLEFNCIIEGQIYLDPAKWILNKKYDKNGNLINATSAFYVYPLIDISEYVGKEIVVWGNTQDQANNCFFDSNNNFISAFKSNISSESFRKISAFVPENAKYLGLTFWSTSQSIPNYVKNARLLISSNAIFEQIPINETIYTSVGIVPMFSHLNKRLALIQQTTPKNVLTDFSKFVYGYYLNDSNERVALADSAIYDDFIPIPTGETKLWMTYAYFYAMTLYDENKNFIVTVHSINDYNATIDISAYPTARYCKLNIKKSTIPTHPDYDGIHPCCAYFGKKYNENDKPSASSLRTFGHVIKKPLSFQGKQITFFGDSITYGYSSAPVWGPITDCYAKLLCDYFGATIDNQAVSGSRISDPDNASSSILNKILNYSGNPDVIFVAGGTNDYGHEQQSVIGRMGDSTYSTIYGAVELMCQRFENDFPDAKVVFITPINRTVEHAAPSINFNELRNAIWRVAVKHGFSVIDGSKLEGFPTFGESALPIRSQLLADGLHPTDNGHVYMANYISGLF